MPGGPTGFQAARRPSASSGGLDGPPQVRRGFYENKDPTQIHPVYLTVAPLRFYFHELEGFLSYE